MKENKAVARFARFAVVILSIAGIGGEDTVSARVHSINPHYGSSAGGTKVYILGTGFSSSANLGVAGEADGLGNTVYFRSDSETVICDVEKDSSHETMIVCDTRPMKVNQAYYIQVVVDGVEVPFATNCFNNPRRWTCSFTPRDSLTAKIQYGYVEENGLQYPVQTALAPGGFITMGGKIFTAIFGSNDQINENGKTVSIRRVRFGGQTCELLSEPDVFYGLRMTGGDNGIVTCKPVTDYVGLNFISFLLNDGYGRAEIASNITYISGKNEIYNFQTYAEITEVSPSEGSVEGGTRIVITGRNFDDTREPIKVFIGGVPCEVVDATLTTTSLECIAGNPPSPKEYYPGSRGVFVETWNEVPSDIEEARNFDNSRLTYQEPNVIDSTKFVWNDEQDDFVAKYTAVFVVPEDNKYKFMVAGDDRSALYIKCEGIHDDLVKVAYSDQATSEFHSTNQVTDWITLENGQLCYFEALLIEEKMSGYLQVAVHRATTSFTAAQSSDAKNEVQDILFAAQYQDETQVLNFVNRSSEEGEVEVQSIVIEAPCIETGGCQIGFRLGYEGVTTRFIEADASEATVQSALKEIFELSDEGISVTASKESEQITYTVAFEMKRGDYSLLSFVKYPADAENLTISIEEVTKGVSSQDSFKLRLGRRATSPIPQTFDEATLHDALDGTRNAYCPEFMLPDYRKTTVVTTMDYEDWFNGWYSNDVQDVEAFCGRKSRLNPDYIYFAGRTADNEFERHGAFDAVENRWLCLAHRGLIHEDFYLTGTFVSDLKSWTGVFTFKNPLIMHEDEWRYSCFDLIDEVVHLNEDFADVTEVVLSALRMPRKDRNHNYYIDALTIGSFKVTDDFDGILGLRTPPALANGHPIKSIAVTKSDDAYTVKVETYNCGNGLDLITIVGASGDDEVAVTRAAAGTEAMSGTFDLTVELDGQDYVVPDISVEILAEDFQERLQSEVVGFGEAKVTLLGSCHAKIYRIEFVSNGGDKPDLKIDISKVTGASDLTVEIKTQQDGGIVHNPMTGDMLRLAYDAPQVEVFVNGYPSRCDGNCQFETTDDATPVISGISPAMGSPADGTIIEITGTNLDTVGSVTSTVNIGESNCNVITNTGESVSCEIQDGAIGTYALSLNVGGKGLAKVESQAVSLDFTVTGSVSSISPNSGFKTGGVIVTIEGYGFSKNTVFNFDSAQCDVVSVTPRIAKCRTPEHTTAELVTVTASDNGIDLGTTSFTYTDADAEITSLNTNTATVNGGSDLIINGMNIGQPDAVVYIGSHVCETVDSTPNQIVCKLPPAATGNYAVNVEFEGKGYASGSETIDYILQVDTVSPDTTSRHGGNKITLTGSGFVEGSTMVKIGNVPCTIDSVTSTQIVCTSGRATKVHQVTNNGWHPTYGNGFAWNSLVLNVEVGDTVLWIWEFDGAEGGTAWGARVFTTATANSNVYDDKGFQSDTEKSQKGSFSFTFNQEGTYYVSTGYLDNDDWGSVVMKQTIYVGPSETTSHVVSVTVAEFEADYITGGGARRRRSTCESMTVVPGCTPGAATPVDGKFVITADECYSPEITALSVTQGYKDTEVVISGNGFALDNCANEVIIGKGQKGEFSCSVTSSSNTEIKCNISPVQDTSTYVAYDVTVLVSGLGYSSSKITADADRRFSLLPSVSGISPAQGSLAGGTLLTISGSGFSLDSTVILQYYPCAIEDFNFFEIHCRTEGAISAGTFDASVIIRGAQVYCTGNCEFTYEDASTPVITNLSPTDDVTEGNTVFTLTGNLLTSETSVKFGTFDCDVSTSTATTTSLTCTVEQLPAGYHELMVLVPGLGNAMIDTSASSIYSDPLIKSMSPIDGSIEGGTVIAFEGNGFGCKDIAVKIGSSDCIVNTNALTNFLMECVTRAQSAGSSDVIVTCGNGEIFPTPSQFTHSAEQTPEISSISPLEGAPGSTITITGSHFDKDNMIVMIGSSECVITAGTAEQVTCTLGEHAGGEYPVTATVSPYGKAKVDIQFTYSFTVSDVDPTTGSFAGGNLLTLNGAGFGSGSIVKVCDSLCKHGDDIEQTSSSYDQIICRLSRMPGDASADKQCDVVVSVNEQSVTKSDSYTFAIDKTPTVTSISPERGGTQGGTSVTITGTLFSSEPNDVDVKIGDVNCAVDSATETTIVCTTDAKGQSSLADIVVTIAGKGQALSNVQFYYIDVWSSNYTWGGLPPPVEGDFVVVPASQTLLIDQDTPVLKMILIQGGTVIFDEKNIHLQTENILIVDGGTLQIGTEDAPFQHKAIITLHGHLRSRELPIYGTKTIGVRNGTLDLHGKHVPYTWTLLDQTAEQGTNILHLKDSVTWKVDDEIVIATTGHRHSQKENEKRVIQAISDDGRTLTLDSPLEYTHISISETVGGITVETHAEVGLLTRNIVIKGSVHMEWSKDIIPACEAGFDTGEFATQTCFQGRFGAEEGSDQFGAQIMIHHRAPGLGIARARIEYVELTNVGQAFRLGRYPIHFHLLGDVNFKSYVRGCAIHRSFNRAVTIHNTHHLLVEHNVVYDVMGGAMFIEDGIEHGNKIEYNLVVFCKQSTSLQNDDVTPAAFWVTNPNNTLQHNAAAGGTHFGFWYRIRSTPDGPSADPTVCQQLHPIEKFFNNTVHSQGWFGLWVFKTYTPRGDGSCGSALPAVAKFEKMVVWNCEKGAELVNVGAIQFHDFVMVHNEKAGVETKQIVDRITWGQVGTYNSFIIAYTDGLSYKPTSRGIILPFSEGYEVDQTTFVNFDQSSTAALGVTSVDGTCTNKCGGWEVHFSNVNFVNSPKKAAFRWQHEVIFRDLDGSLSGVADSLITPYNPTLPPTCEVQDEFSGGTPGVQCIGVKKFHRVAWNKPNPSSLEGKSVILTTEHGNCSIPFLQKRITHKPGWMATMVNGETYEWAFENALQFTNLSYLSTFYNFLGEECVIIKHNLTQVPDKIVIAGINNQYRRTEELSCENNFHGDYNFDNDTSMLTYIVSGRNRVFETNRKKRAISARSATTGAVNRDVNLRVYRCFYKNCIAPPNPNDGPPATSRPDGFLYWNDSSHWSIENGEYLGAFLGDSSTPIPPDNKDIRIHKDAWMVVFTELPKMNKLWLEGVLEIDGNDDSYEVTLSATHIIIMGGRLIVGWEDSPFEGLANIVLRGNHRTPDVVFNGGVAVGSKAIGVLGGLDLHGKGKFPATTHLSSQLSIGENKISLEDSPTNWVIGDEIVIASTGTNPWETETFKIVLIEENVITLNDTAKFNHLSENFILNAVGGVSLDSYAIRAEVSILTRNVKVIGEDYSDLIPESFGARILVAGIGETRGYGRISNVEFYHTGQEGWVDNYDPRYSLAFLNSGSSDDIRPSFVTKNVFHHGFNTAIGVFGASDLTVSKNVIHHTVGPGIRIEGQNITVTNNLVMLTRTKTVYLDRNEIDILLWQASIEVNLGGGITLSDNVVVGSERAGYRIDGHVCETSADDTGNMEWGWNTARATLHGLWMNKDGYSTCTLINKFKIHNSYDAGIYYQGGGSVIISDVLITDSGIAIIPLIFGPASKNHAFQDKSVRIEKSTIVAVSKEGFCPTLASTTDFLGNSGKARAPLKGGNRLAKIGILWPSFLSKQNSAPGKPFVGVNSYPAIGGKTEVTGVAFVNFGDTSCTSENVVFLTNANSEDFMHPIYVSALEFDNSPENTVLYYHRPSLGKINPADCVDMECDGMKKALFVDEDGCVVGGSGGTVIPQAEFEWGGDPRRGLGDYRIPKAMLTNLDGSRIPVEDVAPYKGILRANTTTEHCVTQNVWQAHKCTGYHHGILVIESMDADSDTRRLSPVALLADSYIDLNNGPQDHGWCAGYTCQERLSTFWTIVAFSKTYDLYFTSTSPSKLRLRIINEESSTKMILKIFIKRPQRLDVFTNGFLTFPTNYENGVYSPPATPDQWHPTLAHPPGANYYDRDYQTIYITLAGGDNVVEIRESQVIMITFQLSVDTPDEFFDNGDIINHLALFLDIPPAKIRIVNAIRENSGSRRKRNTGLVQTTVEIGDSAKEVADAALTGNAVTNSLTNEQLLNFAGKISDEFQTNGIEQVLGTGVISLSISDARPEATRNVNFTDRTEESESVSTDFYIPNAIKISQQPTTGFTDTALSPTLTVVGVDADGNDIVLGHSSNPWQATVTIKSPTQSEAVLSVTTANFSSSTGLAEFEDLMISHLGTYVLTIQVTHPADQTGLVIDTDSISIVEMSTVSNESNLLAILLGALGGVLLLGIVVTVVIKSTSFKSKKPYKITPGDSPPPGIYTDSGYSVNPSSVNIVNEAFYVPPDAFPGKA